MTLHVRERALRVETPVRSDCGSAGIDGLFEGRRIRHLRSGAALFVEGDERAFVYRIIEGLAVRTRHLANGARHVVGFVEPGDVIGFKQWRDRYAETIEAASDVAYQAVALDSVAARLSADRTLALDLFADVTRQCRRIEDLFMLRAHQSSYRMLAGFLVRLHALVGLDRQGVLRMPLSRTELADHLGFTAETASRAFARLRDMGLLTPVGRRDVRLLDPEGLKRLAEDPADG